MTTFVALTRYDAVDIMKALVRADIAFTYCPLGNIAIVDQSKVILAKVVINNALAESRYTIVERNQ